MELVYTADLKSAALWIEGSSPSSRTKNLEVWQSPVYCTCLENRRTEMFREFKSHRFRQVLAGVVVAQRFPSPLVAVRFRSGMPFIVKLK